MPKGVKIKTTNILLKEATDLLLIWDVGKRYEKGNHTNPLATVTNVIWCKEIATRSAPSFFFVADIFEVVCANRFLEIFPATVAFFRKT